MDLNENIAEIISNMKNQLTGDKDKDFKYLTSELLKYKESEYYQELSKEVAGLIYDILPEEEKLNFKFAVSDNYIEKKEAFNEALELISKEQYLNAQIILGEEIKGIRRAERDKEEGFVTLSLNNFFEFCIYTQIYTKGVDVRSTPFDYNIFYKVYALTQFKLNKYDKAEQSLKEAIFWNPISMSCLSDLAEIYKIQKKYEKMAETTRLLLEYSYTNKMLAKGYRNLGYYYLQKEDYPTAIGLYAFSNEFEQSPEVVQNLNSIIEKTGKKLKKPSGEEIKAILEEKNLYIGVNPKILTLAKTVFEDSKQKGMLDIARYCLEIIFELTGDREVMKKINEYKNELKKSKNKI